jgi:hypothetical protein
MRSYLHGNQVCTCALYRCQQRYIDVSSAVNVAVVVVLVW